MTTIRSARFDDEAEVIPLIEALFAPPGSKPPTYTRERAAEAFRYAVANDRAEVLLAVIDGRPVGLASVYFDIFSIRFGRRCFIEDLIVLPDQRGKKVGAQLLQAAVEWGRKHGCDHLDLNSGNGRADAHRFYKANGMTQSSFNFTRQL